MNQIVPVVSYEGGVRKVIGEASVTIEENEKIEISLEEVLGSSTVFGTSLEHFRLAER